MATASVLDIDSKNDASNSHVSASITPTANRTLLVAAFVMHDDDADAPVLSVSGGSLTYSAVTGLSLDDTTQSTFPFSGRAWTADSGSSPGTFTVTLSDSAATDWFSSLVIIELADDDTADPFHQDQIAVVGVATPQTDLNDTVTYSPAPTSGRLQILISSAFHDPAAAATWDAPPSGFTSADEDAADSMPIQVLTSTTNTTAALTLGTDDATTYQYLGIMAVEVRDDATPTVDQDAYRWGTDDGTESAHGWEEPENTAMTAPVSTTRLLRTQIEETGGAALTDGYKRQYRRDDEPASEWRDVE